MRIANRTRPGFTIVELLVALALIILIMAILSEAFVAALESVRFLKATGDLQERLRVGATPLRRDLLGRHFVEDEKVSTLRPDPSANDWPDNITGGFLRIEQGAAAIGEGQDPDGLASTRSDSCLLHLSVRSPRPIRREDFFTARVPAPTPPSPLETGGPTPYQQAGTANGTWVEVIYFLHWSGEQLPGTSTRLYSLHRRHKVLPDGADEQNTPPNRLPIPSAPSPYGELAATQRAAAMPPNPYLHCLTPADLLRSDQRSLRAVPIAPPNGYSWPTPFPTGMPTGADNTTVGDDLLLTDVISFEIEVLRRDTFEFLPLSRFGSDYVRGNNRWVFDTSDPALRPGPVATPNRNLLNLRGIKVTLRVWDFKSLMTRQITVIEEL